MSSNGRWRREPLASIISPSATRVEPTSVPPKTPYLSLEHVEPRTGRILGMGTAADVRSTKTEFEPGDVLYGRLRPYLNKVCRPDFSGICSTEFLVFTPPEDVEGEYLRQALSQRQVVQTATHASTGDLPRVSFASLGALEIVIPPREIQLRVASAAEATRLRSANALRRVDRALILSRAAARQTLAHAFRGQLTADWRNGNGASHAVRDVLGELEARRVSEAATPRERAKAELRNVDTGDLPEVPDSWEWVALPDTGFMGRGRSRHRPRNDPTLYGGPYPFIQTGDVTRSDGAIVDFHQTYNENGLAQSKLWPADTVCITIAANIAATGLLTFEAAFPDSVVGVIAEEELVRPRYLELFLRTARADLDRFAPATAQKNINLGILNEVAVPIAPLVEQDEIIRRLDLCFAVLSRVQAHGEAAETRLEALDGSLLSAALGSEEA